MSTTPFPERAQPGWGVAGLVTAAAGLAASLLVAAVLGIRVDPVVGVAEAIIRLTPGGLAEQAIDAVGHWDKPILVAGVVGFVLLAGWFAGRAARTSVWAPQVVFLSLAAVGGLAVLTRPHSQPTDLVPVLVGGVVWLTLLPWLTVPLRTRDTDPSRRDFLLRVGVVGAVAVVLGSFGQFLGRGRRNVEEARRLLRLPVTRPEAPRGADLELRGVPPWRTPNEDFYLIHTAIGVPAIDPTDWRLRIHGLVDRELTITYQDLLDRGLTEAWITLNCVSNEVGGDLIGNAWWSGVRIAELLAEAGVQDGADAVKQTSHDGWTCGTPLEALTDGRNAMLALGMNGSPLPVEHGFPVRMVVPGLYGYVSACKWVIDLEVTRFADFTAYWTDRGWSERGPVKLASRIDVPGADATVAAGTVPVAGSAWQQQTGIAGVEVSLDGGGWTRMELAGTPSDDTWVQWSGSVEAEPGTHELRVRAISKAAETQTGAVADVVPDGATGWHTIEFAAE